MRPLGEAGLDGSNDLIENTSKRGFGMALALGGRGWRGLRRQRLRGHFAAEAIE